MQSRNRVRLLTGALVVCTGLISAGWLGGKYRSAPRGNPQRFKEKRSRTQGHCVGSRREGLAARRFLTLTLRRT